jgi:hypothetical protein
MPITTHDCVTAAAQSAAAPSQEGEALSPTTERKAWGKMAGGDLFQGLPQPKPICQPGVGRVIRPRAFTLQEAGDSMNANVLPPPRTEEQRLESLLQDRLGNRIRNLRIHVLPGGIVLEGQTATYHAKQLAQHAAMELATAPIVANDIQVM